MFSLPHHHKPAGYLIRFAILLAAYFATARLGLKFDAVAGFATLVWPPTGIAIAALLLWGLEFWPAILVGAFLVNFTTGASAPVAFGIGMGNMLEAVAAVWLLLHDAKFRPSLEDPRSVLSLIGFAAGTSILVSATIGTTSLWLGGVIDLAAYPATWQAWWLGDIFGALVVAPLLLVWLGRRPFPKIKGIELKVLEIVALCLVFAGSAYFVLGGAGPLSFNPTVVSFILMIPLIWAGVRYGMRGATIALAAFAALAIYGTAIHQGPFNGPSLHEGLISLQLFIGMTAIIALFLGSAHDERLRADAGSERLQKVLHTQGEYVKSVVELAPIGIKFLDKDSSLLRINPAGLAIIGGEGGRSVMGMPMLSLVVEEDRPIFKDLLARVFAGGQGEMRHGIVGMDGVKRIVDVKLVPMRDGSGAITAALGVFHDVTREVEQADQLVARNKNVIAAALASTEPIDPPIELLRHAHTCESCADWFGDLDLVDENASSAEMLRRVGPLLLKIGELEESAPPSATAVAMREEVDRRDAELLAAVEAFIAKHPALAPEKHEIPMERYASAIIFFRAVDALNLMMRHYSRRGEPQPRFFLLREDGAVFIDGKLAIPAASAQREIGRWIVGERVVPEEEKTPHLAEALRREAAWHDEETCAKLAKWVVAALFYKSDLMRNFRAYAGNLGPPGDAQLEYVPTGTGERDHLDLWK